MADFWIKVEKNTPDKPEILGMSEYLNIKDPDTITGKLIRVWSWFDSNSENGHAPSVTKVLIDRVTGVTGFTDALVKVGWLIETDSDFLMPNFSRHMGKGAKKRAADAERKRRSREKSQTCHTKSVTDNVTKTGPDKSRVDKSREDNKDLKNTLVDSPKKPVNNISAQTLEIFNYWVEVMQKRQGSCRLTSEREKKIKARLKDGYSVDEIKKAIEGCRADPFSMGQNDRQKPFNDIELICRTGKKLESFRDGSRGFSADYKIQQNFDVLNDWINEGGA